MTGGRGPREVAAVTVTADPSTPAGAPPPVGPNRPGNSAPPAGFDPLKMTVLVRARRIMHILFRLDKPAAQAFVAVPLRTRNLVARS